MTLASFLDERGIPYERHAHTTAFTAQRLADAEHVSGYMVAKPVVVRGSSGFAMCVIPAPLHVDLQRVRAILHDPGVRLATEEEMAGLFPDCELGAEPPVGCLYGLTTIMDDRLREDEYLVMQAGTHTEAIRARRADFEKVCRPIVAHITATS